MTDSLQIGLSALSAHQRALEVTSHNIANAATPGYSRQRVGLVSNQPENTRPGQVGTGVQVQSIGRVVDNLVDERLRKSQGENGRLGTLIDHLRIIESVFNEPGANGLSGATDQLFGTFAALSANPDSQALRAAAVQQLDGYASSVADIGNRLIAIRDDLRTALDDQVGTINDLAERIAGLNQQIRGQTILGNRPNDLLDQRGRLIGELSRAIDVRLVVNAADESVTITADGHQLVGIDSSNALRIASDPDGNLSVLLEGGSSLRPSGGSLGALYDLNRTILPELSATLDELAATTVRELNARHAVGVSRTHRAATLSSDQVIRADRAASDLDDPTQDIDHAGHGIPTAFLPSYADAQGRPVARNLTINVLDTATGLAVKHTLRYEPPIAGGGRSLDDLVLALNTGHGGGFTLHPPSAGGVAGMSAKKVAVTGGYRLQLDAATGRSIDFSAALDTRPSATAWTGPTAAVALTGAPDASLSRQRLVFRYQASTGQFLVSTRHPIDGSTVPYGGGTGLLSPQAGAQTIGALTVTLPTPASAYRDGDAFAVDFDASGAVLQKGSTLAGIHTESATWTAGDATMTVRGRYTSALGFDPARPWEMRVLSPGVVGAKADAVAPDAPPVVEFAYWTGSAEAPVRQVVQRTLDATMVSGSPVPIADGVYAVFGPGRLGTAGNHLEFTVDGRPDEAGLLPALGINSLLTGTSAHQIALAARVKADPSQFAVGSTRADGDNGTLLAFAGVRTGRFFAGGTATMDGFYQAAVTGVGAGIVQARRGQESQDVLTASLQHLRDQGSGVSIDEEVGQLILQQQAYTAAARVVSTARENIATLLEILG